MFPLRENTTDLRGKGKATEKDCKIGGLTADYFTDPVLASLRDEVGDGGRYATATHIVLSAVRLPVVELLSDVN